VIQAKELGAMKVTAAVAPCYNLAEVPYPYMAMLEVVAEAQAEENVRTCDDEFSKTDFRDIYIFNN